MHNATEEESPNGAPSMGPSDGSRVASSGFTPRALLLGMVLSFASVLWIRQVELVSFSCQITEAIPPLPALAVVLLYGAAAPLLARANPKWIPTRGEIAVVFFFVAVASVMSAVGVTQAFLPYLTVPHYFSGASPDTDFAAITAALPDWTGPRDPEVIRQFFEGSETRSVPWDAWIGPLACWGAFLLAFWWTALCSWSLLRHQWADRERLTFPLVTIPVGLTEASGTGGQPPLLRNRLMWLGFGTVLAYHVLNVAHLFDASIAAPGAWSWLGRFFPDRPLNALSGLYAWHRPELVGLGYLMPTDILFTAWFSFVLEQVLSVLGVTAGVETAGFPFPVDQGMGGYVVVALAILWFSRKHLAAAVRRALRARGGADDTDEPLGYRAALVGLLVGLTFLVWFTVRAGVAWWLAVGFYAMVLSAGLTYCRIRCESGTPSIWMLTHSDMKFLPVRLFGSDVFRANGSLGSLPCLTQFFWLIHGGFFNQATVYQMESFQLADAVGVRRRGMVWAGLSAVAFGLALAFVMFLTTYYDFGTNVLAGGASTGTGGVRIDYCLQSWKEAADYMTTPVSPDGARRAAFASGALVTLGLLGVRAALLRSWLSPLGYLMAAVNGMQLWWAFLLAWTAKAVVLKLGGGTAYRRYVPFFLGIAIGHFFLAGVVWGTISVFLPDNSYTIWFT